MSQARADAACIVLPDGRVLVTGGSDGTANLATAEVYDAGEGTWQSLGSMSVARSGHTATATPWGAVLLVGGEDTGAVELFLTNDTFETLGTLATSRTDYAIAATTGHKVVIAGGSHGNSTLASIEIYDGDTGKIVPGGAMLAARRNFAAAALLDGTILLHRGIRRRRRHPRHLRNLRPRTWAHPSPVRPCRRPAPITRPAYCPVTAACSWLAAPMKMA